MRKGKAITKCIVAFSSAVLFFLCPFGALTALADESGRVDSFTGEPIDYYEDTGITYEDQSRRAITNNCFYDYSIGCFVYPVGTGLSEVTASVADGMIVNSPVTITVPAGMSYALLRYGTETEFDGTVRSTGEYTFQVNTGDRVTNLFTFTIVGSSTGIISSYRMPEGFRIKSVTKDGADADWSGTYISMEEEGQYYIEYMCEKTELNYYLSVFIDHTPPQIVLEGLKEDGKARGPVTITGLQEGDRVAITKDGENFKTISNKLTQAGRYELTVVDNAENSITYQFIIMIYLDTNGIVFFLVIAAVIGAVVAYILIKRKNLRVR